MNCLWCHNFESLSFKKELSLNTNCVNCQKCSICPNDVCASDTLKSFYT